MKNAIRKAVEGGYIMKRKDLKLIELKNIETFEITNSKSALLSTNDVCMDKLFWQCLGKSLGWKQYPSCIVCDRYDCDHVDGYKSKWGIAWHNFIDHIADGGDVDEFFNNLIK